MRVVFYLFFPAGGIGHSTHELVKKLTECESDIDTEVVCLPEYHWRDTDHYKTWPHLRTINHPRPWRRKLRFLIAQLVNPRRLFRRVKETRTDIVHICNINHLSYPTWEYLINRSGVKVAVSVHDVRRAKAIVNRAWESFQLRRFYRRADALFVHSEAQRNDLLAYAGCDAARVHVVPIGPLPQPAPSGTQDTLRERYGIAVDCSVGLFFGIVRDEKNLAALLEAMAGLAPERKFHLVIAGRCHTAGNLDFKAYENQIASLELGEQVTILDRFIPDQELADLFELSNCCLLPYLTSFTSQSGVLSTAVHFRLPVLATPCPTFAEVLGICRVGVLCESDEVEAIRLGLETLLDELARGVTYDFDGYEERFSWRENARVSAGVYRSLFNSRREGE